MQRIKVLLIVIPLILVFNSFQDDMEKSSVLFCYGRVKPELIKDYKYVVVESKHFSKKEVTLMRKQNQKVFAYISLGEINKNAIHYKDFKEYTLGKNKIWDSYYIDLKSKKANELLQKMVDEIFSLGYDGLFLDNIDNFTIHGPQKDQTEEVISIIQSIKEKYPKKMYIQNAGLDLLPETSRFIDLVAVESVATAYNFKEKTYKLSDSAFFESRLSQINTISATYSIPFIMVEYANSKELADQVKERIEPTGFEFFVGSIELQTIPKFKK